MVHSNLVAVSCTGGACKKKHETGGLQEKNVKPGGLQEKNMKPGGLEEEKKTWNWGAWEKTG